VRSDELWFWHSGGPLTLRLGADGPSPAEPADSPDSGPLPRSGSAPDNAEPSAPVSTRAVVVLLGPDVFAGQQPQALVAGGIWQCAAPAADEAVLVSCVVAPGFDFADFRLA